MKVQQIFFLGVMLCLLTSCTRHSTDKLRSRISELLSERKREVGVAIILPDGDTLTVNNHERYPLMSVVKFHQALAVADWLEAKGCSVDTILRIGREELRPNTYSPLRDAYPEADSLALSVNELLRYTLQLSDNNAADILFRHIASPATVEQHLRTAWQQDGFGIAVTEEDMHQAPTRGIENWSTPLAAVRLFETFHARRDSTPSLQRIYELMSECRTGLDRLPAPLQGTATRLLHKTGTGAPTADGQLTGINDAGLVLLPDGRHYSLAVFIRSSAESMPQTTGLIADISRTVYEWVVQE